MVGNQMTGLWENMYKINARWVGAGARGVRVCVCFREYTYTYKVWW